MPRAQQLHRQEPARLYFKKNRTKHLHEGPLPRDLHPMGGGPQHVGCNSSPSDNITGPLTLRAPLPSLGSQHQQTSALLSHVGAFFKKKNFFN